MAWTRDQQSSMGKDRTYTIALTADGAGAFTADVSEDMGPGWLTAVDWVPGGTTPDSSVNLTIKNAAGVDLLNGAGTGIDMTALGRVTPIDENGNAVPAPCKGVLTLLVASNATVSATVTLYVHMSFRGR